MDKLIPLVLSFLVYGYGDCVTYDQRQQGEINVQVELKDLQIIALLKGGKEEYVDYDYVYDYSEMTIKPPNGKPPKPLNATNAVTEGITTPTTVFIEQTTETIIKNMSSISLNTTDATLNSSTTTITSDSTTFKPLEQVSTTLTLDVDKNLTTTTATTSSSTPTSVCKKGFVQNSKGNCELKLQATSNALLKIVKLSQKLKLRRGNRKGEAGSS